jgi:hypothetical protein
MSFASGTESLIPSSLQRAMMHIKAASKSKLKDLGELRMLKKRLLHVDGQCNCVGHCPGLPNLAVARWDPPHLQGIWVATLVTSTVIFTTMSKLH